MWPLSLWHRVEARVVMLSACIRRRSDSLSPTGRLFRAFRAASDDHPWDNYRRFASFWTRGVPYWRMCVRATVAVNSVCAGEQRTIEKRHYYSHTRSATRPTQLLISIQKYKTVHVLRQQTWTTLVDSLPVGKTDAQKLPTTLELRENGRRRHSRQRNAGMHAYECTQVTVKLCRRRCLVLSTWHVINSITGYTSWKPVTGNRFSERITGYYWHTGYCFNKPN